MAPGLIVTRLRSAKQAQVCWIYGFKFSIRFRRENAIEMTQEGEVLADLRQSLKEGALTLSLSSRCFWAG